jgi:hypothetical protein
MGLFRHQDYPKLHPTDLSQYFYQANFVVSYKEVLDNQLVGVLDVIPRGMILNHCSIKNSA